MTDPNPTVRAVPGFWTWLVIRDSQGHRGLSNVFNVWLVFHFFAAIALAGLLEIHPAVIARSVALPGAAILVGLAFGWAGRSASILQDKSFSKFLIHHGAPPEGYVYAFQLAILSMLIFIAVSLILLSGGLGFSFGDEAVNNFLNRFLLFFIASIAVRESWGIIYFVNKLTIQYYRVRERELSLGE